jgi:hypothetical protein
MATQTADPHAEVLQLRARYDVAAERPVTQAVDGLTVLTGVYLAVSPWVVGFNRFATLTANDLITGIALAAPALGLASAYGRTHGMAWVTPVVGVWTIIAPWVVSGDMATAATIWSNVVTGALAVLLGLAAVAVGDSAMARTPK